VSILIAYLAIRVNQDEVISFNLSDCGPILFFDDARPIHFDLRQLSFDGGFVRCRFRTSQRDRVCVGRRRLTCAAKVKRSQRSECDKNGGNCDVSFHFPYAPLRKAVYQASSPKSESSQCGFPDGARLTAPEFLTRNKST